MKTMTYIMVGLLFSSCGLTLILYPKQEAPAAPVQAIKCEQPQTVLVDRKIVIETKNGQIVNIYSHKRMDIIILDTSKSDNKTDFIKGCRGIPKNSWKQIEAKP